MKELLFPIQILLSSLKVAEVIDAPWWIVLMPLEIITINALMHIGAFAYGYPSERYRRKMMSPGERAAEDLARYYATHKSKF